MASDQHFVDYVCEQAYPAAALTYKRMFGEYALYLDGKVVAFVCDNHVFLKPTAEGRQALGTVAEHPAYPGSKLYFRLDDEIENREQLQRVLRVTAAALPLPKPKAVKSAVAVKGPPKRPVKPETP